MTEAVTVDLLDTDETVVVSGLRVDGKQTSYSDEVADAGTGQVVIPYGVDGFDDVNEDSLLRFKVGGTVDWTARVVPPLDKTVAAKNWSDVQLVVRCADWLSEFDDHLIQPPMGRGVLPEWSEVAYDWRHPIVPLTGAVAPTYLGSMFGGDVDPLGGSVTPQPAAKTGWPAQNWADVFTGWNSGAAVDGSGSHPVDAVCYATVDLPVATGRLNGQFSADDFGELAVGGVIVSRCSDWTKAQDWGLDSVTSGTLTVRLRVLNDIVAGNPTNVHNVLAWAVTVWQATGSDQFKQLGNVLARTGSDTGASDPLTLGGKWSALWSPVSPPGITVARAVRHQFELAQAAGGPAGDWTLDFSDTLDSNGSTLTARSDITARVNDTNLAWFRQLSARRIADLSADPTTRKLRLHLPGERGDFHTTPASPPTFTGQHLSQVDVARRW